MTLKTDLSILDRPEILNYLFHPRKESGMPLPAFAANQEIETDENIRIDIIS